MPPVEGSVDDQGVFTPLPRGATDRSLSNFDHRHRLAFTYVYEIPCVFHARQVHHKLGHVLNGWQISGTTSFQSGTPYNVTTGFDTNGDGVPNDRPSLANPQAPLDSYAFAGVWASRLSSLHTLPLNGTYCDGPTLWFSGQCAPVSLSQVHWVVPANGQGNVGRNSLTGPWYNTWAFALTRTIQVREGQRLQMRAEVFNPFNQGAWRWGRVLARYAAGFQHRACRLSSALYLCRLCRFAARWAHDADADEYSFPSAALRWRFP